MSNTDLKPFTNSPIAILGDNLITTCMEFLTLVSYLRLRRVNRYFRLLRNAEFVWTCVTRSFSFACLDINLVISPEISPLTSVSAIEGFYRSYTRQVNYTAASPLFLFINDWIYDLSRPNSSKSLSPLRRAGCFCSRDVRRLLHNHLSRFFTGGANEGNSAQITCHDEQLGVADGISETMELITRREGAVYHNDGIAVQFVGALLTRSYGITFMEISPLYVEHGQDRPRYGAYMDINPLDVDRLNSVFSSLYSGFVSFEFN